jgi:hypothetical protein
MIIKYLIASMTSYNSQKLTSMPSRSFSRWTSSKFPTGIIVEDNSLYFNATSLCREVDIEKRFFRFYKDSSPLMIKYASLLGIHERDMTFTIYGSSETSGTYIHHKLVNHLSVWLSDEASFYVPELLSRAISRLESEGEF